MENISWIQGIPKKYKNSSLPHLIFEITFDVSDGAQVTYGDLIATFKCRELGLEFGIHASCDGYFYHKIRNGILVFIPKELEELKRKALEQGISLKNLCDTHYSLGVIYSSFEELCDIEYGFEYNINIDLITNSKCVTMEEYCIVQPHRRRFGSIRMELKNNLPLLTFSYPKTTNINKGDKIYFANSNKVFCGFDVIQSPYSENNHDKAIVCKLLEDDINMLYNNDFEKIVIEHQDGRPYHNIENIWARNFNYSSLIQNTLEPSKTIFKRYVNTYKLALEKVNFQFTKTRNIESNIDFTPCYVYIMHDLNSGYHKIGISKDPHYREKTLQSEKPVIKMICAKEYPSRKIAEALESALHKAYESKRIRGEWFNLSEIDVIMLQKALQ